MEELQQLRAAAAKWANPPAELVSKLPRYSGPRDTPKAQRRREACQICSSYHEVPAIHLDYMGHADVTLALIDVDPSWSWEPCAYDENGLPRVVNRDGRLTLWAWLTVCGVRRLAVGTCEATKSDPEKELVGDLLRNGAMRFGIGTALWSKADIHDDPPQKPAPAAATKPEPKKKPAPTDDYIEAAVLKLRANALDPAQKALLLERWPIKLSKPIPDRIPPTVAAELEAVLDSIENPPPTPVPVPDCATCGKAARCPLPIAVALEDPQCRLYEGEQNQ